MHDVEVALRFHQVSFAPGIQFEKLLFGMLNASSALLSHCLVWNSRYFLQEGLKGLGIEGVEL